MRMTVSLAAGFCLFAGVAFSEGGKLPADAVQLKGAEIGTWLDGKSFDVVVHDAGAPLTAVTNFDLGSKRVTGSFVYDGTPGEFENEWVIKGDTSCGEKDAAGDLICQRIYVREDVMYEVTKDGIVHATSRVRN